MTKSIPALLTVCAILLGGVAISQSVGAITPTTKTPSRRPLPADCPEMILWSTVVEIEDVGFVGSSWKPVDLTRGVSGLPETTLDNGYEWVINRVDVVGSSEAIDLLLESRSTEPLYRVFGTTTPAKHFESGAPGGIHVGPIQAGDRLMVARAPGTAGFSDLTVQLCGYAVPVTP